MSDFETKAVDLSMRNAETGRPLTANVYKMTFDDGSSRIMSMGQLVMAVCLARAVEKENSIIEMMNEMANTTAKIEALSDIEQQILTQQETSDDAYLFAISGSWTILGEDGEPRVFTHADELMAYLGLDTGTTNPDRLIDTIESALDQNNTMSQSQMISLQSETNKRDQSYEMISNVIKSLYTVLSGVANNV